MIAVDWLAGSVSMREDALDVSELRRETDDEEVSTGGEEDSRLVDAPETDVMESVLEVETVAKDEEFKPLSEPLLEP